MNDENGRDDSDIIDDMERERRSLQRQQEEHQNAIRRAWGPKVCIPTHNIQKQISRQCLIIY